MAFSPEEIENREFTTGLRGYEVDEVTRFLKVVAQDYRMMLAGVSPGAAEGVEATDLSHIGEEVNTILEAANAAAVKLTLEAQGKAVAMVQEAEGRSAERVTEAEGRANEIVEAAEGRALEIVAAAEGDVAARVAALEDERRRLHEAHSTLREALRKTGALFESTGEDAEDFAAELEAQPEAPADVVVGPPAPPEPPESDVDESGSGEDFGGPVSIGRSDREGEDSDGPPIPPELSSTTG